MLTYRLFIIQTKLMSATTRKGQPNSDLHPVQNPEHAPFSNNQGRASQMLTYILFKTQNMLLSATTKKDKPDGDFHAVLNTEHALVRNKQKGPARC